MQTVGTNDFVARKFARKEKARSGNGNIHTDGSSIFSYDMEIGRWIDGQAVVLNPPKCSRTTRRHVGDLYAGLRKEEVDGKTVSGYEADTNYRSGWENEYIYSYYNIDNITWSDVEIVMRYNDTIDWIEIWNTTPDDTREFMAETNGITVAEFERQLIGKREIMKRIMKIRNIQIENENKNEVLDDRKHSLS